MNRVKFDDVWNWFRLYALVIAIVWWLNLWSEGYFS